MHDGGRTKLRAAAGRRACPTTTRCSYCSSQASRLVLLLAYIMYLVQMLHSRAHHNTSSLFLTFPLFFVLQVSFIIVRVSSDHPTVLRGPLLSPYQQQKKVNYLKSRPLTLACAVKSLFSHTWCPSIPRNPAVADRLVLASNVHCSPSHGPPQTRISPRG